MKSISFNNLGTSDLIIDAIYEGGSAKHALGDPISKLIPGSGNLGGFRASGRGEQKNFVVLYTSGQDKDWPDRLDPITGRFTYFGDNRTPGHELHDTPRKGNLILKNSFEWLHSSPSGRDKIPPFFIFEKYPTSKSSRSVQFKGLAVPGFPGLSATEDLVAVWKTTKGQRFQNYRGTFTILDIPSILRAWISDLSSGVSSSIHEPPPWEQFRRSGKYTPLTSAPTRTIRTVQEQTPANQQQEQILRVVFEYFKNTPTRFEAFAAKLYQLHDQKAIIDEITRGAVDGGRDAIGRYALGVTTDPVYAEFALEAKCYRPPIGDQKPNTVGVKEVARLISRIRHRQFGVLVTTSVIAKQAYEEVREDQHPIIFLCGRDIAEILIDKGHNTPGLVEQYLKNEFPL